jgi:hypothetical protein
LTPSSSSAYPQSLGCPIEGIATDALTELDRDTFWPSCPRDDGVGDGNPSFYTSAAGVIWALDYLHRIPATRLLEGFRPILSKLLEWPIAAFKTNSPADYAKHHDDVSSKVT